KLDYVALIVNTSNFVLGRYVFEPVKVAAAFCEPDVLAHRAGRNHSRYGAGGRHNEFLECNLVRMFRSGDCCTVRVSYFHGPAHEKVAEANKGIYAGPLEGEGPFFRDIHVIRKQCQVFCNDNMGQLRANIFPRDRISYLHNKRRGLKIWRLVAHYDGVIGAETGDCTAT